MGCDGIIGSTEYLRRGKRLAEKRPSFLKAPMMGLEIARYEGKIRFLKLKDEIEVMNIYPVDRDRSGISAVYMFASEV